MKRKVEIYTDGANAPSRQLSGFALVVLDGNNIIYKFADYFGPHMTNNQMELRAMIAALEFAEENKHLLCHIFSDSQYVVKSINEWMDGWARNSWRGSKGVVENIDLMKAIYELKNRLTNIRVEHVAGHAGNGGNELADALCTKNMKKYKEIIDYFEYEDLTE